MYSFQRIISATLLQPLLVALGLITFFLYQNESSFALLIFLYYLSVTTLFLGVQAAVYAILMEFAAEIFLKKFGVLNILIFISISVFLGLLSGLSIMFLNRDIEFIITTVISSILISFPLITLHWFEKKKFLRNTNISNQPGLHNLMGARRKKTLVYTGYKSFNDRQLVR